MDSFHIDNSQKNEISFGKRAKKTYINRKEDLSSDCFNSSKSKKQSKKKELKNGAILVAGLIALSGGLKGCNANKVYDDIGEAQVELSDFSYDYYDDYVNSDETSKDVETATKKADFYACLPIIGSYMHSNKGQDLIEDAVADEGNIVNGYIDSDVAQGIISDCWLITAVENLSYTPAGAQAIHDAISVNENGDIDVYFKGPDLTYTVALEDITKGNKSYSVYSRGDDDMLVLELAVEQFREDLKENKIDIDETLPSYLYYTNTGTTNALNLGETRQAYWLLTGITDSIVAQTEDEIADVLQTYKESPQTSLLDVELSKTAKVKDINGTTTYIYGSHGYGVKEITDDTITLVCSSYTNKDIVLSLDTLYELPIDMLVYCQTE